MIGPQGHLQYDTLQQWAVFKTHFGYLYMETVLGFEPPHMDITFSWGWGLQYTHMAAMSLCVVPLVGAIDAQLGLWAGCVESPLPLHLHKAGRWKMAIVFEKKTHFQGSYSPMKRLTAKGGRIGLGTFKGTIAFKTPAPFGILVTIDQHILLLKLGSD